MLDNQAQNALAEKLTLLASGLADETLAAEVQESVASDRELAARFAFLQAIAGDEFSDVADRQDPRAHLGDAELKLWLRDALESREQPMIVSAFVELVRRYGGYARTLLVKYFPPLRDDHFHEVMRMALLRARDTIFELDSTDESVETWFLRIVGQEGAFLLKRHSEQEYQWRKAEILKTHGTISESGPSRTSDGEPSRTSEPREIRQ